MLCRHLTAALIPALVTGCATSGEAYNGSRHQWEYSPPKAEGEARIGWAFMTPDQIRFHCQRNDVLACYKVAGGICWIFVPAPVDFNDTQSLKSLGHEVLHCMGARHE